MGRALPRRLLLGPGPSNVHPRVLRAMAQPLVGHLDPAFFAVVEEVQEGLRTLFGTRNRMTLPLSGTGSLGMQAAFANLVEPGDPVVIGVAGVFGERMCEVARRLGAEVTAVTVAPGSIVPEDAMAEAIAQARPRLVALVHAETSTGVCQPVEGIGRATREAGAYFVLDCVTSLAGLPLCLDDWGVDAAYSGTQKCLSCPPGLAPATFSDRALDRVRTRRMPVSSWYLDLGLLADYYGEARAYHHTAPISMVMALAEALRLVAEEGFPDREERHRNAAAALLDGMLPFGFEPLVEEPYRLPMLSALRLPKTIPAEQEGLLRRQLLEKYGIEVGGGLGPLAGRIWRIGLMGENARLTNVEALLSALRRELG